MKNKKLIITISILVILTLVFAIIWNMTNTKEVKISSINGSDVKLSNASIQIKYGDVNQDGKVNVDDYLLVRKYIAGLEKLNDNQIKLADVDGNGMVTITDADLIQRKIAGIIDTFPVEEVAEDEMLLGDVNQDGRVDISDVTLLQIYLIGRVTFNEEQKKAADINGDSIININDITNLQIKLVQQ